MSEGGREEGRKEAGFTRYRAATDSDGERGKGERGEREESEGEREGEREGVRE